jgi:hypothetical protein
MDTGSIKIMIREDKKISISNTNSISDIHIDLKAGFTQAFEFMLDNYKPQIWFAFDCIKVTVFIFLFLFIHVKVNG